MPFWLLFTLMSFANFRITRLIVKDDFPPILWVRNKIIDFRADHIVKDREDGQSYLEHWWGGALVSCCWCSSAYSSGAMVAIIWFLHGMPLPIMVWFAVWGTSAYLVNKFG